MHQPMIGPLAAAVEGEEFVTATVPRAFTLTLNDHRDVRVQAGTQELPKSIAEHWYAKANGVSVYVPVKAPKVEKPVAEVVRPTITAKKS